MAKKFGEWVGTDLPALPVGLQSGDKIPIVRADTPYSFEFPRFAFGGYYFSTPAATTLAAATPAKAAGTTTAGQLDGFTHSDNRLTYGAGEPTQWFQVLGTISSSKAGGGATTGEFFIAKNDSVIVNSRILRNLPNTSDVGALAVGANVQLAAGDYVEIWVETANGDDLTVEAGGLGVSFIGT